MNLFFSKLSYTENMARPAQNKAAKFHLITIKESKYDLLCDSSLKTVSLLFYPYYGEIRVLFTPPQLFPFFFS